jgi:hypothetical protein
MIINSLPRPFQVFVTSLSLSATAIHLTFDDLGGLQLQKEQWNNLCDEEGNFEHVFNVYCKA